MKEKLKNLFIFFAPLLFGILSSFFVDKDFYQEINLPSLAPPSIVFPIVWTILYLLMGVVILRIYKSKNKETLQLFITQLVVNFVWVISFFQVKLFLLSFIILIALVMLVLYLLLILKKTDKISFYFFLPYFLWCCFASHLNWAIFLIN